MGQFTMQRVRTNALIDEIKTCPELLEARDIIGKKKSSPVTGLEWPRGFQEVKVPRFLDNGTVWW
jgi:hypothetical protein